MIRAIAPQRLKKHEGGVELPSRTKIAEDGEIAALGHADLEA